MKSIKFHTIIDNALILICLLAFWGGVVYKLYALNWPGVIMALILVIISFYCLQKYFHADTAEHAAKNNLSNKFNLFNSFLTALYLVVIFVLFFTLYQNSATDAIISPWQAVPAYFFFFYFLATGLLLMSAKKTGRLALPLLCLHYFFSFSVALIVYKIGYGFDPFIHRATEALIAKTGAVDPKPLYYLGQYGLVVIPHKIFFLPILWLDKLLVPVLAAIFLPVYLWRFFRKRMDNHHNAAILILLALAIPCSFFIVTTPQNLAYLFLLLAVLIGGTGSDKRGLAIIYLLAAAALVTQPIAGIPALLYAAALTLKHVGQKTLKRAGPAIIFLTAAAGLPLAFLIVEHGMSGAIGGWQWQNLLSLSLVWPTMPHGNSFLYNFIYLYAFNLKFAYAATAGAGGWIAYRRKNILRSFSPNLLLAAGMAFAHLLSRALAFDYLIGYERTDFPSRLLIVAAIFILPFALLALRDFYGKLMGQTRPIIVSFAFFAVLLVTASLYISYPRFDDYFNSHGYSTGAADIKAAHWIDQNARSDYIVLADQQTSAAALQEFGFKKYYEMTGGQIFYYPIPTGGPLYQYYLDMVYGEPSRQTAEAAMDLVGVNKAYFVLDKYWWASPKIIEEAKLGADSWRAIDNGEVYVFKYKRGED